MVTVGVGRLRDHTWTLLGSTEAQRGADVDFLKRVTIPHFGNSDDRFLKLTVWDGDRTLGYALVQISAATMLAKGDEFPLKSDDPEAEAALAIGTAAACVCARTWKTTTAPGASPLGGEPPAVPGQESAQAESHSERKAAPAAAASPFQIHVEDPRPSYVQLTLIWWV